MCVRRRSDSNMAADGGLRGGASCHHRTKKGLFKSKASVIKRLKSTKRVCDDCERLIKSGQPTPENCCSEVVICVSCGHLACNEHAKKHCEAARSGNVHPFLMELNKGIIRCHPCDVELEPLEDPHDPIRVFYNEYRSFTKMKAEFSNRKVSDQQRVFVEGAHGQSTERNGLAIGSNESVMPAKGLPNLGNTCFFNSVMQCVMHTNHLGYYFERFGRVTKLDFVESRVITVLEEKVQLNPASIPIPLDDAPLNGVLRGFLAEFRCGTSPSPAPVFSQISRKAPRFKGWQQQDAHELLRYLLDGLRSEELERYKAGIAAYLGVSLKTNQKKFDRDIVLAAKSYLQAAGRPLLDAVFGGTLLQTIRCCECGHVSERNEQFLDLSIPLSSNPMTTRISTNKAPNVSTYQKKKAEKLSRKNNRRLYRKHISQEKGLLKENNNVKDFDENSVETVNGLDDLEISDESVDEDCDVEKLEAGTNPLDFTKVLVAPPAEYNQERSIGSCLLEFTAEERLAGSNAYECEKCCSPRNKKVDAKGAQKKLVEALKRYLIYEPPVVLTLHLKRFHQLRGMMGRPSTRKLGGHVSFPICFDIAPFCCKNVERISPGQKRVLYSLYGVVVHSGDLSGGHYIAYVKSRKRITQALKFLECSRASCADALSSAVVAQLDTVPKDDSVVPDGQWYYCSDNRVTAVPESRVLSAEAYILFYERVL